MDDVSCLSDGACRRDIQDGFLLVLRGDGTQEDIFIMELQKRIDETLGNLAAAILAIRATGGWKYREQLPLSADKIDKWVDHAIKALQEMSVNLLVAEAMLEEKPPSILAYIFHKANRRPRWDIYRQRRGEYLAVLRKKK